MSQPVDITVKKISKTFYFSDGKPLEVFADVDFEVFRGELLCILGPSGCGKTTLLRVLLGLEKPTNGEVTLDPERLKGGTAYVQQQSVLLPWRTLVQNVALGRELRGKLDGIAIHSILDDLDSFGLRGFEDSLAAKLSGGMKQRAALLRALISRPKMLFCDEPFSAIDFVTRLKLNTRFKKMCAVEGITTIFVTHNIEEAIFLGSRILVFGSGTPSKIIAEHTPTLSVGAEDAVRCRESPEYAKIFHDLWDDLKDAVAQGF